MPTTEQFTRAFHEWSEVFMRRSMRDFKRFMDDSGLSPSQINALMRLHYRGKCGVSDIGEHLGVTNAAASQMVDRMVQLGLFPFALAVIDVPHFLIQPAHVLEGGLWVL